MCKFVKKMYGNEFLGRSVGPLDQYRGKKNFFLRFQHFSDNYALIKIRIKFLMVFN